MGLKYTFGSNSVRFAVVLDTTVSDPPHTHTHTSCSDRANTTIKILHNVARLITIEKRVFPRAKYHVLDAFVCGVQDEFRNRTYSVCGVVGKRENACSASIIRKEQRMIYEWKAFIDAYDVLRVRVRVAVTENSNKRRDIQIFARSVETTECFVNIYCASNVFNESANNKKKNRNKTTLCCWYESIFFFARYRRSPPPSSSRPVPSCPSNIYIKKKKKEKSRQYGPFITPSDTGKRPFIYCFVFFYTRDCGDSTIQMPLLHSQPPEQRSCVCVCVVRAPRIVFQTPFCTQDNIRTRTEHSQTRPLVRWAGVCELFRGDPI